MLYGSPSLVFLQSSPLSRGKCSRPHPVLPTSEEDSDVARERQRVLDGLTAMDVVTVNSLSKSYMRKVSKWAAMHDSSRAYCALKMYDSTVSSCYEFGS